MRFTFACALLVSASVAFHVHWPWTDDEKNKDDTVNDDDVTQTVPETTDDQTQSTTEVDDNSTKTAFNQVVINAMQSGKFSFNCEDPNAY